MINIKEDEKLNVLNHSCAHLLAQAISHIYPGSKFWVGPVIEEGFYDGLTFHRLVPGFVLQGGDPEGNGTGGPGYTIDGEFQANGYEKNTLSHDKGVISMARSSDYDSAGSQFFIVLDDSAKYSLDNLYAGFGKVIEGMDVIEEIEDNEEIANDSTGALAQNITITKVTVDTFGYDYKVKKN